MTYHTNKTWLMYHTHAVVSFSSWLHELEDLEEARKSLADKRGVLGDEHIITRRAREIVEDLEHWEQKKRVQYEEDEASVTRLQSLLKQGLERDEERDRRRMPGIMTLGHMRTCECELCMDQYDNC